MKIGFLKSKIIPLMPNVINDLKKLNLEIYFEKNIGDFIGVDDEEFEKLGAKGLTKHEILSICDILVYYKFDEKDLEHIRRESILIGLFDPYFNKERIKLLSEKNLTVFSLELMPRISRAQNMDVLSSMATLAGYKAVIIASYYFNRIFPMLMTAAGNLLPARVFVIGAGVAGLSAIATARRLGAQVSAYDVRPTVKEQVESLGAKFVDLGLFAQEEKYGYAKAMDEEFYKKQREAMKEYIKDVDIIITTAAVLGAKAPILITKDMVEVMRKGSIIVDLAIERGGNCELTKYNEVYEYNGVKIIGIPDLPSTIPYHASFMYSNNIKNFLKVLIKENTLNLNDEITKETLLINRGEINEKFK
ncbi:MAG: NAD(P) transhydrogenase subunit alpha [candidate division WOR-3 bacterium]|jgi:NAD(P) transhydrogenase subunit alpha